MQQSGLLLAFLPCIIIIAFGLVGTDGLLPCTNSFFACGKPVVEPYSFRIYGGHKAQRGAWPWLVILTLNGYTYCGGAIINERFILTATHCFLEDSDPRNWRVVAGKTRTDRTEPGQKTVKVDKIIMHEDFNLTNVKNDIALLLLDEPMPFSTLIKPICLPNATDVPKVGETCILAGWGETETRNENDQISLNQVLLPIIADDLCSLPNWYGADFLPDTTLCAGYEEGGKDACSGDSGGPLISKTGDKWVVKGISSWGYYCGAKYWPGIYTDVTQYLPWIHTNMASNFPCASSSHLG